MLKTLTYFQGPRQMPAIKFTLESDGAMLKWPRASEPPRKSL